MKERERVYAPTDHLHITLQCSHQVMIESLLPVMYCPEVL